jgi:signal transduction histidine kinase
VIGTLSFCAEDRDRFSEDEVELMRITSHQAAIGLEHQRLVDELRSRAAELAESNSDLERKVQERTAELAQRAAHLRALAGELTISEQRERKRLANILHDHLQQLLVGAKFRIVELFRHTDPVVQHTTKQVEQLLDESIQASRSLTSELSPPILHEGSFKAGLDWLVRWTASKHKLAVNLSIGSAIPPLAEDIKILLFESVRELLFNAVKHAQAESASVDVYRLEDERLRITVADDGLGFDPGQLRDVGENGHGFGLFSIRERLSLIGGQIEIDSSPGKGSRFTLTAPIGATLETETAGLPLAMQQPTDRLAVNRTLSKLGVPIRVLLADDHAVMREGLARLLVREPDIEILGEATNGQEAVEIAGKLVPDVILMDLSMPKLNGVEATRAIASHHPDIRIIGLSMFEEEERARAMIDAGAVKYLTKSSPSADLINAIRKCMVG